MLQKKPDGRIPGKNIMFMQIWTNQRSANHPAGVCDGTHSQLSHTGHVDLGGLQSRLLVLKVPPSLQPTTPPRLLQKASAF